jgi:hypothetical protein
MSALGIDPVHLRRWVIEPTLRALGDRYASEAAIRLLLGTAAHESFCGRWLHQVSGPAVGIYQMEPRTHDDVARRLSRDTELGMRVYRLSNDAYAAAMAWDLRYATAMARAYYWYDPAPLPDADDIGGLAAYAKRRWNTSAGKATVEDYRAGLLRTRVAWAVT